MGRSRRARPPYERCGVDALNLASLLGEIKCAAETLGYKGGEHALSPRLRKSIEMTMTSVEVDLEALGECGFAGVHAHQLHKAADVLRKAITPPGRGGEPAGDAEDIVESADKVLNVLYSITQPERALYH